MITAVSSSHSVLAHAIVLARSMFAIPSSILLLRPTSHFDLIKCEEWLMPCPCSLALSEIRLTLAHMLWHFDIELCEETDHRWLEQKSWFTWQKKPMVVGLRDRDSDKHST